MASCGDERKLAEIARRDAVRALEVYLGKFIKKMAGLCGRYRFTTEAIVGVRWNHANVLLRHGEAQ